jgi:hypothetical protein
MECRGGAKYTPRKTETVVIASEVIEHVRRPDEFVATLARLLVGTSGSADDASGGGSGSSGGAGKVPGLLIVSTLNRTPASFAVAVVRSKHNPFSHPPIHPAIHPYPSTHPSIRCRWEPSTSREWCRWARTTGGGSSRRRS